MDFSKGESISAVYPVLETAVRVFRMIWPCSNKNMPFFLVFFFKRYFVTGRIYAMNFWFILDGLSCYAVRTNCSPFDNKLYWVTCEEWVSKTAG